MRQAVFFRVSIVCIAVCAAQAYAADWPMWRYDAGRTSASPEELPGELHLEWSRRYPAREPCWDDPLNQDLMHFDEVFEPIVLGNTLYIGFNDADKVAAFDLDSGAEKWTRYVDGPVRLPLAGWEGRIFFTSDDGFLHCLDAEDGALLWRFQGAPGNRNILGNKRLISTWPARGGPVVAGGIVYFASSIWPFMGTFIYALEAETGKLVWLNDSNGPEWMIQPHGAPSFGGVAPQGAFVVLGDKLLAPGGRSVPACFDRQTGRLLHYTHAKNNKTGGAFVCAINDVFFNHYREDITDLYEAETADRLASRIGRYPVLTPETYYFSGTSIRAMDAQKLRKKPEAAQDSVLWSFPVDATGDLIKAGRCFYAGGEGRITAVNMPREGGEPAIAWTKILAGHVKRLLAANGRLIAVTLEGEILVFGPEKITPRQIACLPAPVEAPPEAIQEALSIIERTGVRAGYALYYGAGQSELLEALLSTSDLHIIATDVDAATVETLRRRFDTLGLYGKRVAVLQGAPSSLDTPPYMAALTIVNAPGFSVENAAALVKKLHTSMRPYGGVALLRACTSPAVAEAAAEIGLETRSEGDDLLLVREGPLEGAGTWTHQLGDIAQTGKSDDQLVKLPLGLLWFGGSSNLDVLTRHGHGPPEQVVGGRLFIEGMNCMSARDVYTGRVIWKTELPDLGIYGVYYDHTYKDTPTNTRYNQVHIPGANIRGTNFVAAPDKVYVIQGASAHVLDVETGATVHVITLPPIDPEARRKAYPDWGYIGVYEDTLFGGVGFVAFSDLLQEKKEDYSHWEDFDKSASRKLLAMDRHTGEVRWQMDSLHGFLHNGIAAGNNRLFCLDRLPIHVEKKLRRRGQRPEEPYRLLALDVETGDALWQDEEGVFGSFLTYSVEHDILLQATRPSSDTVAGEQGTRMTAYQGADGTVLWERRKGYATFPLLHGATIVTESGMFDLLSGEPLTRKDPLTNAKVPWAWNRQYGCNYPIASEHLLTFRSGAAGFYDFANQSGTGNFGGFRSSCTSNLVAADGVLNAPDYTRTCSCSYQNQTSLALAHMPELEMWTYNKLAAPEGPIKQVGINFGAPGDRRAENGTLWLDYPALGGDSPEIAIEITPQEPQWYRHHSLRFRGDAPTWVAASGGEGLQGISILLRPEASGERPYTVRLHFAEPEDLEIRERVFDVTLQGETVLRDFDCVREAGGVRCGVVKTFVYVLVQEELKISLQPSGARPAILCGVEVAAEGW